MPGEKLTEIDGLNFVSFLTAVPSDEVRDGPHVYQNTPYRPIKRQPQEPKQSY